MSCPTGKYIVHFTSVASSTAQVDFELVVKTMFNHKDNPTVDEKKPNLLWNCYFNHIIRSPIEALPENVIITQDPDNFFGCEAMLVEAEGIFRKLCPEEEVFISPVPHPEDIIFENEGEVQQQPATENSNSTTEPKDPSTSQKEDPEGNTAQL